MCYDHVINLTYTPMTVLFLKVDYIPRTIAVVDLGGARRPCPHPGPVKISHEKDGHRRRPHRFHVSRPLPYLNAGSATALLGNGIVGIFVLLKYEKELECAS